MWCYEMNSLMQAACQLQLRTNIVPTEAVLLLTTVFLNHNVIAGTVAVIVRTHGSNGNSTAVLEPEEQPAVSATGKSSCCIDVWCYKVEASC
jgi:hypothetical protein